MLDQHGQELPDWLVPAREHEQHFTLADLNVVREHGTKRAKALVAVIDHLVQQVQFLESENLSLQHQLYDAR